MVQRALKALRHSERPVSSGYIGPARDILINRAKAELKARQHRHHFLPPSMFGEPAWEMLIALYLSDEGRETVCNLISGAELPHATGLRWLNVLENHRLIIRKPHSKDKRVILIELTEIGGWTMDNYFLTIPII